MSLYKHHMRFERRHENRPVRSKIDRKETQFTELNRADKNYLVM